MESSNNEKINGYLVYKRKRKQTSSEESKSCSSNAISSYLKTSKARALDHLDKQACSGGRDEYAAEGASQRPNCSDNDNLSDPVLIAKSDDSKKNLYLDKVSNTSPSCSSCPKTKNNLKFSKYEAVSSKSSKSHSTDEDHNCQTKVSVKFSRSAMEPQGGATVSDVVDRGTIIRQTPNKIKRDKLLILRDVLEGSMKQRDKPEQNTDGIKRQDLLYAQAGRPLKEKYAILRTRQKERLAWSNTSKWLPLYSGLTGSKQSSDFQIGNYDASVRSNALGYKWIGVDVGQSSSMSLSRQDVTNPNTSLHMKDGSASLFTSSKSFHKNIDINTSSRPSGFLKRKDKMNDWSELELDCLWIGVRRYGQGNWNTILEDPASKRYLKNRTAEDLSVRWNMEILKLFSPPKPTSSSLSTMPAKLIPPISDRNGFPDPTSSRTRVPPHPTSINRSPVAVANQKLGSTNSIHSQKPGSWDPFRIPSSSRPYHSSAIGSTADASPCPSNVNLEPMVSELLFQTLNQRADLETNVRSARLKSLQTPAASVATNRRSSQTVAEPNFLLGGLYLLPKANEGENLIPSDTESSHSVVDLVVVESDKETEYSSERTLSD